MKFIDFLLEESVANDGFFQVIEDLSKMAISDLPGGKRVNSPFHFTPKAYGDAAKEIDWQQPPHDFLELTSHPKREFFDYSDILKPQHTKQGLRLIIGHKPNEDGKSYKDHDIHGYLVKKSKNDKGEAEDQIVGFIHGAFKGPDSLKMHYSYISPNYRGQKLGVPLYEAFLKHGSKKFGAKTINGGLHSSQAATVHMALAKKHGLGYEVNTDEDLVEDGRVKDPKPGDSALGNYKYAIKSEMNLNKGWKDAFLGGAALLAGAIPSTPSRANELNPELAAISMLESSGGKNINHKANPKGEFHTAVGSVGFKPVSAFDQYNKSDYLKNKYPNLDDQSRFIHEFKNNAKFYNDIANEHWKHLKRQLGSSSKAAYGWRHGPHAAHEAQSNLIEQDPYVAKFLKLVSTVKKSENLYKAIGDLPKANPIKEEKNVFDYSHLLPKEHQNAGYKLHVRENKGFGTAQASLYHPAHKDAIGTTGGSIEDGKLNIIASKLHEGHRGKGLGQSMYESVMAHAKHHLGAEKVAGETHSTLASRVHQALSRKHGLNYKPELSGSELSKPVGANDDRFGPYEYALKDEVNLDKADFEILDYDLDNKLNEFKLKFKDWQNHLQTNNDLVIPDISELELESAHEGTPPTELQEKLAIKLLGNDFTLDECLRAACFISSKGWPTEDRIKEALDLYEDELEEAALYACNLPRTLENVTLLHVIMDLNAVDELTKSEDIYSELDMKAKYDVLPVVPESAEAAKIVAKAFKEKKVFPITLQGGKFSKGSKIAIDPDLGMMWLLKPTLRKISPAAGIREELAGQAQREAAFYQLACLVGLRNLVPRTYLISINGKLVAAMPFLPPDFDSINNIRKIDPTKIEEALDAYWRVGQLHRWAVLSYICGSVDEHAGNILLSKDGSVALIDHGATFAGKAFSPGIDVSTFVPFYLRYKFQGKFKKLSRQEKFNQMPNLSPEADTQLCDWINDICELDIVATLDRYGIDSGPTVERLRKLKCLPGPRWVIINSLWAGLI